MATCGTSSSTFISADFCFTTFCDGATQERGLCPVWVFYNQSQNGMLWKCLDVDQGPFVGDDPNKCCYFTATPQF